MTPLSANDQKRCKNEAICAVLLICRTLSLFGPPTAPASSIPLVWR